MLKAYSLAALATGLCGCFLTGSHWKGAVEWPDEASRKKVVPFTEAGAALAAAAAIREMIRENPYPDLFSGCSSPEQGLDISVSTGPMPGLYYVLVDQRFDRCGGPGVRVLDGWYEYAVTAQGEVVGKAPPSPADDAFTSPIPSSNPPPAEQLPPPVTPTPPGPVPETVPPAVLEPQPRNKPPKEHTSSGSPRAFIKCRIQ